MAARVLLLGILFTEVLEPVCAAGVRGSSGGYGGKNGSKIDGTDGLGRTKGAEATLEIEPGGNVVLGKRGITLSCLYSGNNQDISWLYNGVPAPPCGIARCALLHNGSLHFYKKQNLQLSQKWKGRDGVSSPIGTVTNKHEYRCVAQTNSGGYLRSSPTFVQVAELSHTFKQSPEDLTVGEGEIARFSCLIDGLPFPPNITWQHNGETVELDRNSAKYYLIPPGVLYISATKLSDAGSYRCIATNDFIKKTKKSKEAKLTVNSGPRTTEPAVPISLFPQISYAHRLINGSSLSLACAVAAGGYPSSSSSSVTWTFFPRYSDGDSGGALPRILLNSTKGIAILELTNTSLSNAGLYSCSAKNFDGPKVLQNVTLEILVSPTFLKKPASQSFPNGRTARFECQAQGNPTPKIYWLKDSANLTINGRRTMYTREGNKMELAISATVPSDSGVYQCVAVNEAGEIWAAGRLQVNTSRNSPAAPTSLKCHAPSPVKIFISWEPPKSLPSTSITAYTVYYSPEDGGKEEVSPPEPGNSTSVQVTKLLEPFTNYSMYVRVWNTHGASDQSATIVCSTAPSVPKGIPKIRVDVLSSTKINVSWTPLVKKVARGIIDEYKIQWKLHNQPASQVHYLPASVRHFQLTDLIPGAHYDLRVLAKTRQGWPNMSETRLDWTSFIMPSLKSDEPNVRNFINIKLTHVNATTIKITWNWKDTFNVYLPRLNIDGWKIQCQNGKGDKIMTVTLPINITEYLFTNLETNVSYTMGLCMMDSGIVIDCLSETIESTQASPDNVPTDLQAVQISSTKILVTWTVSEITGAQTFQVCHQPVYVANSNGTTECIVVQDAESIIIDNLKPFTMYQFKVRKFRDVTDVTSEFSESIECYTSEDVPGQPEDVEWFLDNRTNAKIAWKEPTETNGIVENYFVSYTTDVRESTLTSGNVTVPGNKTSASLVGLVAGRRYDVIVQAATKAGYGPPSDPIFVIIGGTNPHKILTKTDQQKPPDKTKHDQSLGIIIGVSISICCITVCLCSIYCRRKCENSRSFRESSKESEKSRALMRASNGYCIERSTTPVNSQQMRAIPQIACNEIELAELCPSSPTRTNSQCDTKGAHTANGLVENCVKEPLLTPWDSHDESKDLGITVENPLTCKQSNSSNVSNDEPEPEADLNMTELTIVDCCTLADSDNSLNNNLVCRNADASPRKAAPITIPILEPNG